MVIFNSETISYIAYLIIFPAISGAETILSNINGYTSRAWGRKQFSRMVIDEYSLIVAVTGEKIFDADEKELSR